VSREARWLVVWVIPYTLRVANATGRIAQFANARNTLALPSGLSTLSMAQQLRELEEFSSRCGMFYCTRGIEREMVSVMPQDPRAGASLR